MLKDFFWNRKWTVSVTAGILLGLAFPPFPFPFLVFPALILVFRLIDLSDSAREAAYYAYPGLVIWNLIATYWLMLAHVAAGVAAILANAAVMTLPVMLQYLAQKKFNRIWVIALLQSAFWISFEFLHHNWDLAWPWLSLGNAWANTPELIQYISVTGYLGASFWIVLASSLGYQAITHMNRPAGYAATVITVAFPLISLIQLSTYTTESDTSIEVAVVQPNFDSYQNFGGFESPEEAMQMLLQLSDSIRTDQTELIVWPENGIHPALYNRKMTNQTANRVKELLLSRAAKWGVPIIGGATYVEYYLSEQAPPLPRGSATNPWMYYNSALAFYPDRSLQVYRKHNLVPIVERIPFLEVLDAVDILDWVDWQSIQGYGKGSTANAFPVESTQTPALVCYDSVFPGWVREFVNNDAGFLTIITNDGWWGNTSGHAQHFAYARLRAIEFRRWIVRSANNGISGIIAPDGEVKVKTNYWKRTAFSYEVPVITEKTIYAQFGNWLPIGLLMISGFGITFMFVLKPSRRESREKQETLSG